MSPSPTPPTDVARSRYRDLPRCSPEDESMLLATAGGTRTGFPFRPLLSRSRTLLDNSNVFLVGLSISAVPLLVALCQAGNFFGFREDFVGLAIIVNTNRYLLSGGKPGEPMGRHRDVSVVANNGTRYYDDLIASMEGCNANVRFDERRDDFNVMQVRSYEESRSYGSGIQVSSRVSLRCLFDLPGQAVWA